MLQYSYELTHTIMNNLRLRVKGLPLEKIQAMRAKILSSGVSQPTYDRFLNGQSQNMRCATLMADYLGISVQELLDPDFELARKEVQP